MGFKSGKSKDKDTSTQLSSYSTKTSGPAIARTSKSGSGTYAEKGGRAAAASHHGSAWSKSVAYGGHSDDDDDDDDDKRNSRQVSSRFNHTYTFGNASAGVVKGGSFAQAGPGGYAEAAYRDGSKFGASVAYGGKEKGDTSQKLQKKKNRSLHPKKTHDPTIHLKKLLNM